MKYVMLNPTRKSPHGRKNSVKPTKCLAKYEFGKSGWNYSVRVNKISGQSERAIFKLSRPEICNIAKRKKDTNAILHKTSAIDCVRVTMITKVQAAVSPSFRRHDIFLKRNSLSEVTSKGIRTRDCALFKRLNINQVAESSHERALERHVDCDRVIEIAGIDCCTQQRWIIHLAERKREIESERAVRRSWRTPGHEV